MASTPFFRCSECDQEWTSECCWNADCPAGRESFRRQAGTRHPKAIQGGQLPDDWDPPKDFFTHAGCGGSLLFSGPLGAADTARCDTCGALWLWVHPGWFEEEQPPRSLWVRQREP